MMKAVTRLKYPAKYILCLDQKLNYIQILPTQMNFHSNACFSWTGHSDKEGVRFMFCVCVGLVKVAIYNLGGGIKCTEVKVFKTFSEMKAASPSAATSS